MINRALSEGCNRILVGMIGGLFCLSTALVLMPVAVMAADATNKLVAVSVDSGPDGVNVNIETANPVGYRYTVYDSIDPIRVVVDFPGLDVSDVIAPEVSGNAPIKEVKVSSFDLTSGKLGRLEIILDGQSTYDVVLEDTLFKMSFDTALPASEETVAESTDTTQEVVAAAGAETVESTEAEPVTEPETASYTEDASMISGVTINDSSLSFNADGHVGIFKYFKLGAPPRLVVDIYGVKAGFKNKKYDLANGFEQLRVGSYKDKIRFVLDASDSIPEYSVVGADNSVTVAWGDAVGEEVPFVASSNVSGVPVNVEAVDFDIEDNESVVRVTLSGTASIIEPTVKDDIVGFGVKNASISRALRRAIDASSFPSSIRLVTPYTVLVGKSQDVRFAVELKGPSEYSVSADGNVVTLKVVNGPFAEPEAPSGGTVAVDLPAGEMLDTERDDTELPVDSDAEPVTADSENIVTTIEDSEIGEIDLALQDIPEVEKISRSRAYPNNRFRY